MAAKKSIVASVFMIILVVSLVALLAFVVTARAVTKNVKVQNLSNKIGVSSNNVLSGNVDLCFKLANDPQGYTPFGYMSWDVKAKVDTNLAVQEMILSTDNLGDIYQNTNLGSSPYIEPNPDDFPASPELEFDTYVTLGAWDYPTPTMVVGGAVDIQQNANLVFDTQNLSIAWAPQGGYFSGAGAFQIARLTLKDGATGNWRLKSWQTGGNSKYVNGIFPIHGIAGDANGDGLVSADDTASVQANFGKTCSNAGWCNYADFNQDGQVTDADRTIWADNYGMVCASWCNGADIDKDGDVDGVDYGIWQAEYPRTDCASPEWCNGADIDKDGDVDGVDYGIWQAEYPSTGCSYTLCPGDANLDGKVSDADYTIWDDNYGASGCYGGFCYGDANGDGLVSADDYASVQANFGNTC